MKPKRSTSNSSDDKSTVRNNGNRHLSSNQLDNSSVNYHYRKLRRNPILVIAKGLLKISAFILPV
jgi:hypothetical protein